MPDVESRPSDSSAAAAATEVQQENGSSSAAGKRRRGRNPADREYKRLKRWGIFRSFIVCIHPRHLNKQNICLIFISFSWRRVLMCVADAFHGL